MSVHSRSTRYADSLKLFVTERPVIPSILHDPVMDLASAMQEKSARKFEHFPASAARSALTSLIMDAVRVHRAVGALVDSGWPGESGPLLRTEIDIAVSCLALVHSKEPERAALRYQLAGLRRYNRDQGFSKDSRARFMDGIRHHLRRLLPEQRQLAAEVLREKDRPYWFGEEFGAPTDVLSRFANEEVRWNYMQLSGAAHGSFVGLRLNREDPDVFGIDPDPRGPRTVATDLFSCKFTLETLTIRNTAESLGFEDQIAALGERIRVAGRDLM